MNEFLYIQSTLVCIDCGHIRPPTGTNWGIRYLSCKVCILKERIVNSAEEAKLEPVRKNRDR
jgi:hypothetical protein